GAEKCGAGAAMCGAGGATCGIAGGAAICGAGAAAPPPPPRLICAVAWVSKTGETSAMAARAQKPLGRMPNPARRHSRTRRTCRAGCMLRQRPPGGFHAPDYPFIVAGRRYADENVRQSKNPERVQIPPERNALAAPLAGWKAVPGPQRRARKPF